LHSSVTVRSLFLFFCSFRFRVEPRHPEVDSDINVHRFDDHHHPSIIISPHSFLLPPSRFLSSFVNASISRSGNWNASSSSTFHAIDIGIHRTCIPLGQDSTIHHSWTLSTSTTTMPEPRESFSGSSTLFLAVTAEYGCHLIPSSHVGYVCADRLRHFYKTTTPSL